VRNIPSQIFAAQSPLFPSRLSTITSKLLSGEETVPSRHQGANQSSRKEQEILDSLTCHQKDKVPTAASTAELLSELGSQTLDYPATLQSRRWSPRMPNNVYKTIMIEPEKRKRRHADPVLYSEHLKQMPSRHTHFQQHLNFPLYAEPPIWYAEDSAAPLVMNELQQHCISTQQAAPGFQGSTEKDGDEADRAKKVKVACSSLDGDPRMAEDSKKTLRQKCTRYDATPLRDEFNASQKDKKKQGKTRKVQIQTFRLQFQTLPIAWRHQSYISRASCRSNENSSTPNGAEPVRDFFNKKVSVQSSKHLRLMPACLNNKKTSLPLVNINPFTPESYRTLFLQSKRKP
ncbi:hypothetical protein U0070_003278, partial [Myodes glareolus]